MKELGIESSMLGHIKTGRKTVEGRLGKERFLNIKTGDVLSVREDVWQDGQITESLKDAARVCVTQVVRFETFREMLESIDPKALVPTAEDIDEAEAAYRQFYSAEDEQNYGVVAIQFQLVTF